MLLIADAKGPIVVEGQHFRRLRQADLRAIRRERALILICRNAHRMGVLLGYPQCCIDAFMDAGGCHPRVGPRAESVWWGTGFVPCAKCEQRDSGVLWREIMSRRHVHGVRLRLTYPTQQLAAFARSRM